ncbi:MAG: tRNA (cytidine(34)-2'-O)-methyltransferase [Beijerinckiaceae bacterium]
MFQPDIPQNAGTMLRMAACFGLSADIIEPAGFPVSDRHFRRSGMDYLDQLEITRHVSWSAFNATRLEDKRRLVLLTTKGAVPHTNFAFAPDDIIMVGRESAGAPPEVHAAADARVVVPMMADARSLNVAVSAAIVVGEALRQLGRFDCSGSTIANQA